MLPQVGDNVKFTDEFIKNVPQAWTSALKDVELEVLGIKLDSLLPHPRYTVTVIGQGTINVVSAKQDGTYDPHPNSSPNPMVFDAVEFEELDDEEFDLSYPTYEGPQPLQLEPKKEVDDDRCNKCGTMGKSMGLSCVCPNCGNVIWGI